MERVRPREPTSSPTCGPDGREGLTYLDGSEGTVGGYIQGTITLWV